MIVEEDGGQHGALTIHRLDVTAFSHRSIKIKEEMNRLEPLMEASVRKFTPAHDRVE